MATMGPFSPPKEATLSLVRLFAALFAPVLAQLAEPPPVRLTLGPKASAFFRRMEDLAHEHGLSCSADELATATASSLEQLLGEQDQEQDEELAAIAAKLEGLDDRVDSIAHSAAIDGLTQQIGQVILASHKPGGAQPARDFCHCPACIAQRGQSASEAKPPDRAAS